MIGLWFRCKEGQENEDANFLIFQLPEGHLKCARQKIWHIKRFPNGTEEPLDLSWRPCFHLGIMVQSFLGVLSKDRQEHRPGMVCWVLGLPYMDSYFRRTRPLDVKWPRKR